MPSSRARVELHENRGGGSVGSLRGIAGGDRALCAEGGFELRQSIERGVGARAFVGGKDALCHFRLARRCAGSDGGDRHRNQLPGETPGGLRRESLLMAGEREGILIGAGDFVVAGDPLGGEAHGQQRCGIVIREPGVGAGLEAAKGQQAHRFDAAGQHHAVTVDADAMIGLDNCFQTGCAEAVDGNARNLDRQTRRAERQSGRHSSPARPPAVRSPG